MNSLLLNQLVSLVHRHVLLKRDHKNKLLLKRRRLRALLLHLGEIKDFDRVIIRRAWCFERSQNFITDIFTRPDDIFFRHFRMSKNTFNQILNNIKPFLTKMSPLRECISPQIRLASALYVLKSGADFKVIGDTYGISSSSVCNIMNEFFEAMITVYLKTTIVFPQTVEQQQEVANTFFEKWDFPDTVGSIDGSHIPILTPLENGPDYFNYKLFHSIILQAVVDANYRFLNVFAGCPGKMNDGGVFSMSQIGLNIFDLVKEPFHLIGDVAYPLSPKLLKPFKQSELNSEKRELFNYRLSRARMVIEDAFGRLKGRWRILLRRIDWEIPKTVKCIVVCCILHNILENNREPFLEAWRQRVRENEANLPRQQHHNYDYPEGNQAKRLGMQKREQLAQRLYDEHENNAE